MMGWIKKKRWWLVIGTVIVIAVVGWVMNRNGEEEARETMVVEYTMVRDEVDVTGAVEPTERYNLSFSTPGVLKTLTVKEGEQVTAGQILASIDASDTAWMAAQAKAVVIGDLETAQLALVKEQEGVTDLKTVDAAKLEESKQTVRNAKAALDIAKDQWQRIKDEDTDEASVVYTAAEAAYTAALNAHQAAQDNLTVLKKTIAQAEASAQAEVTAAEKVLSLKEESINSSGDVSVNQAGLRYQQSLLSKAVMKAPASGVVAKIEGRIGEYVSPTSAVVTMVSEVLQLSANVPETEAARLSIDDPAVVTFEAYRDEEFMAKVSNIDSIETVIDGVTTYEVTFVFSEQDERLRSGMTADAVVLVEEKQHVLAVPQRAIDGEAGQRAVNVVRGERTERVMVETGLRGSDGLIEITSGLRAGDEVVTFDPNAEE